MTSSLAISLFAVIIASVAVAIALRPRIYYLAPVSRNRRRIPPLGMLPAKWEAPSAN